VECGLTAGFAELRGKRVKDLIAGGGVEIEEHRADADAEVRKTVGQESAVGQMAQAKAMGFVRAFNAALHRTLPYFSTLRFHVVTL
jgi:hypothetical protein